MKDKKVLLISIIFLITGFIIGNKASIEVFAFSYGNTVAIVNQDVTQKYEDEELNFAFYAINLLEDVTKYNFDIVSSIKAKEGLNNDYYIASLEFPSDFSKNILTVNQKNPQKAVINYTINKKMPSNYQYEVLKDINYYFYIINNCINYMYTYGIFEGIHKSQVYINDIKENNEKSVDYFNELLELKLLDGYDFSYDDLDMLGIGEEVDGYKQIIKAYINENKEVVDEYLAKLLLKEKIIKTIEGKGYSYFENTFQFSKENIINRTDSLDKEIRAIDTLLEYDELYKIINQQFNDLFSINRDYIAFNNKINNKIADFVDEIDNIINDPSSSSISFFSSDFIKSRINFERDIKLYKYCSTHPSSEDYDCSDMDLIKLKGKESLQEYKKALEVLQTHIDNINNLYNDIFLCRSKECLSYADNYLNAVAGDSQNAYPVFEDEPKITDELGDLKIYFESITSPVIPSGGYFETPDKLGKISCGYFICKDHEILPGEEALGVVGETIQVPTADIKFSIDSESHYLMYDDGSGSKKRVVTEGDLEDESIITINDIFGGECKETETGSTLIDKQCIILSNVVYKHNTYGEENKYIEEALMWILDPNYQDRVLEEGAEDYFFVNKEDITSDIGKTTPSSIYADIFGYHYCNNGGNYTYAKKSTSGEYTCTTGQPQEVSGILTIGEGIPTLKTGVDYLFNIDPKIGAIETEKYNKAQDLVDNSLNEKIDTDKEELTKRTDEILEDVDEVKNDDNYQKEVQEKVNFENDNNSDSNNKLNDLANLMSNSSDQGVNNTAVYDFVVNPLDINNADDWTIEIDENNKGIIYFIIFLLIIIIMLFILIKTMINIKKT